MFCLTVLVLPHIIHCSSPVLVLLTRASIFASREPSDKIVNYWMLQYPDKNIYNLQRQFFLLFSVIITGVSVQTVFRFELLWTKWARISRCCDVSFHMFFHIRFLLNRVATRKTHECSIYLFLNHRFKLIINLPQIVRPNYKSRTKHNIWTALMILNILHTAVIK